MDKISKRLDLEIEEAFDEMSTSEDMDKLEKLYRLRIDEAKNRNETVTKLASSAVDIVGKLGCIVAYGAWLKSIFKFEKDGIIVTKAFNWLPKIKI